jgi:Holliday junction resolvase RusA-like endonuclease
MKSKPNLSSECSDGTGELLVRLSVRGEPKSQPRPRFVGGRVISNISPAVSSWQSAVQRAASEALCAIERGLLDKATALRVDVTFFFPTKVSARWGKPHTQKPDRDNCDKLILDECTKVGLFGGDDCRVSAGMIRKYWCRPGGEGAVVEVSIDTSGAPWEGLDSTSSMTTADEAPDWVKRNPPRPGSLACLNDLNRR